MAKADLRSWLPRFIVNPTPLRSPLVEVDWAKPFRRRAWLRDPRQGELAGARPHLILAVRYGRQIHLHAVFLVGEPLPDRADVLWLAVQPLFPLLLSDKLRRSQRELANNFSHRR